MKTIISICLLMLFLSSCKDEVTGTDSGNPPPNEVFISGNSFNPSSITVAKGVTIKWTNKDAVTHTATSSSGPVSFDSGNLGKDQSFSFKFDSTGTYSYFCKIHTNMKGTVIVQ